MEILRVENLTKIYGKDQTKVVALDNVSFTISKGEFVAIVGASGSGKSTLLHIMGGVDRPTSGKVFIDGKDIYKFNDDELAIFRRRQVGLIYQFYNLIPILSVEENITLPFDLDGRKVNKKNLNELIKLLGLEGRKNHLPNELSGGQQQRTSIGRALITNPAIILADEPTGALDTKTSVQVMEILKKISKDKLIIMVTHNPDLAEKYSSRIIKILDGKIIDDSNPYEIKDEKEVEKAKKRRTSMKFFTALRLSLNNLMTKKGRTLLTSFAGSIGIIGIALILAISTGVQNYINKVEEDTLSSYPVSIEESTIDMSSMMEAMMGQTNSDTSNYEDGKIYSSDIMGEMITTLSNKVENNNLTELRKYIKEGNNGITENSNAIQYNYNLNMNLYKEDTENGIVRVNPSTVMNALGMGEMLEARNNSSMYSMMSGSSAMQMASNTDVWTKMLDNEELLHSQYDLLAGSWPKNYNEVVLIATENNEISDYTLYALGLKDQKELEKKWNAVQKGEEISEEEQTSYTYDELLNLSFKLILNSDCYQKENGIWLDKSEDEEYMKNKLNEVESVKVVGIIRQNEETVASSMAGGIGYLKELEEYVINKSNDAEIVKEQKENQEINVFSGLKFPTEEERNTNFDYNSLSNEQKMAMSRLSSEQIAQMMEAYTENKNASYEKNLEKLGAIDLDKPTSISIYPKNFEAKEKISDAIEEYNQKQRDEGKEENVINYTDMVGIMMKSVSQIIDIISYVLIAFVAISLVVSSIMIGIITYISVLERTKEIGILRAIGASKKDISRVFNAETFIIGFISGLLGIGITMLLTIPINSGIYAITGVSVKTMVPPVAGVVLVLISMFLTIIAGLVPSKMASKKDPVEALRTE